MVTITLPRKLNTVSEKGTDRIGATLVDDRFDLLRSFALTSLLVMLIIGSLSGMLLVKRIVERHDGSISLSSQVGSGTTVSINFPMV